LRSTSGTDPITRRRIRLRETCKDLVSAQIALGRLLGQAQSGKEPESGATVAQLLEMYMRSPSGTYRRARGLRAMSVAPYGRGSGTLGA